MSQLAGVGLTLLFGKPTAGYSAFVAIAPPAIWCVVFVALAVALWWGDGRQRALGRPTLALFLAGSAVGTCFVVVAALFLVARGYVTTAQAVYLPAAAAGFWVGSEGVAPRGKRRG